MRRLVLLVYALIFASELLQSAVIPLLPTFAAEFDLSKVEAGALLGATPVAMLVVSVPIGLLADRVGARFLTVGAGALLTVAALVQGFADSYWSLLAGRVGFGVAFGMVWTAGPTLISTATTRGRATALGGTVVAGGLAHLVGPAFAGNLAEAVGVSAPFTVIAGLAAALTALLMLRASPKRPEQEGPTLVATLRAIRGQRHVLSAIALIALLGGSSSTIALLVPLQLGENGLSAGRIGAIFSAASLVWIVASTVAARTGERVVGLRVAGAGALLLGGSLVLPVLSAATAVLVIFLLLRSLFHAPLSALSYPLGEVGARLAGIGGGAVIGLMNVAWATSAFIAPLAGGALAQSAGEQFTYALISACCVAVAVIVYTASRRAAREGETVELSA